MTRVAELLFAVVASGVDEVTCAVLSTQPFAFVIPATMRTCAEADAARLASSASEDRLRLRHARDVAVIVVAVVEHDRRRPR